MAPYCFCVESLSRILSGPRDLTWEPVVDEAGGWPYRIVVSRQDGVRI